MSAHTLFADYVTLLSAPLRCLCYAMFYDAAMPLRALFSPCHAMFIFICQRYACQRVFFHADITKHMFTTICRALTLPLLPLRYARQYVMIAIALLLSASAAMLLPAAATRYAMMPRQDMATTSSPTATLLLLMLPVFMPVISARQRRRRHIVTISTTSSHQHNTNATPCHNTPTSPSHVARFCMPRLCFFMLLCYRAFRYAAFFNMLRDNVIAYTMESDGYYSAFNIGISHAAAYALLLLICFFDYVGSRFSSYDVLLMPCFFIFFAADISPCYAFRDVLFFVC